MDEDTRANRSGGTLHMPTGTLSPSAGQPESYVYWCLPPAKQPSHLWRVVSSGLAWLTSSGCLLILLEQKGLQGLFCQMLQGEGDMTPLGGKHLESMLRGPRLSMSKGTKTLLGGTCCSAMQNCYGLHFNMLSKLRVIHILKQLPHSPF